MDELSAPGVQRGFEQLAKVRFVSSIQPDGLQRREQSPANFGHLMYGRREAQSWLLLFVIATSKIRGPRTKVESQARRQHWHAMRAIR